MISEVKCIDNMEYMAEFPDKFFELAIVDTHLGSQSSRIASHIEGFYFYGCELDPEYFEKGCKRYEQHIQQQTLFTP